MRHVLLVAIARASATIRAGTARGNDVSTYEQTFGSQFRDCRSAQPQRNNIRPSLYSVVGRHSGMIPGFHYSTANCAFGPMWDPGRRAELIANLATLR